jgi:hypothetical protein
MPVKKPGNQFCTRGTVCDVARRGLTHRGLGATVARAQQHKEHDKEHLVQKDAHGAVAARAQVPRIRGRDVGAVDGHEEECEKNDPGDNLRVSVLPWRHLSSSRVGTQRGHGASDRVTWQFSTSE